MTIGSSPRGAAPVIWAVVHTAEGARTAESLAAYFNQPGVNASSHAGIDDYKILQYVSYDRAAWTLRSGNPTSDNAELCGFASWSRAIWLNEHYGMLVNTANWLRSRCAARGIPTQHLSVVQVSKHAWGIIGHVDYTLATHDGTHTDPGPNFPWDVVIRLAQGGAGPAPVPAESTNHRHEIDMLQLPPTDMAGDFQEVVVALYPQGGSTRVDQVWVHIANTNGATEFQVAHWQCGGPDDHHAVPVVGLNGVGIDPLGMRGSFQAPDDAYALVLDYKSELGASVCIDTLRN